MYKEIVRYMRNQLGISISESTRVPADAAVAIKEMFHPGVSEKFVSKGFRFHIDGRVLHMSRPKNISDLLRVLADERITQVREALIGGDVINDLSRFRDRTFTRRFVAATGYQPPPAFLAARSFQTAMSHAWSEFDDENTLERQFGWKPGPLLRTDAELDPVHLGFLEADNDSPWTACDVPGTVLADQFRSWAPMDPPLPVLRNILVEFIESVGDRLGDGDLSEELWPALFAAWHFVGWCRRNDEDLDEMEHNASVRQLAAHDIIVLDEALHARLIPWSGKYKWSGRRDGLCAAICDALDVATGPGDKSHLIRKLSDEVEHIVNEAGVEWSFKAPRTVADMVREVPKLLGEIGSCCERPEQRNVIAKAAAACLDAVERVIEISVHDGMVASTKATLEELLQVSERFLIGHYAEYGWELHAESTRKSIAELRRRLASTLVTRVCKKQPVAKRPRKAKKSKLFKNWEESGFSLPGSDYFDGLAKAFAGAVFISEPAKLSESGLAQVEPPESMVDLLRLMLDKNAKYISGVQIAGAEAERPQQWPDADLRQQFKRSTGREMPTDLRLVYSLERVLCRAFSGLAHNSKQHEALFQTFMIGEAEPRFEHPDSEHIALELECGLDCRVTMSLNSYSYLPDESESSRPNAYWIGNIGEDGPFCWEVGVDPYECDTEWVITHVLRSYCQGIFYEFVDGEMPEPVEDGEVADILTYAKNPKRLGKSLQYSCASFWEFMIQMFAIWVILGWYQQNESAFKRSGKLHRSHEYDTDGPVPFFCGAPFTHALIPTRSNRNEFIKMVDDLWSGRDSLIQTIYEPKFNARLGGFYGLKVPSLLAEHAKTILDEGGFELPILVGLISLSEAAESRCKPGRGNGRKTMELRAEALRRARVLLVQGYENAGWTWHAQRCAAVLATIND